jgi:hypothetical protein
LRRKKVAAMVLTFTLLASLLLVRSLVVARELARDELVRRRRRGIVTTELRRRVGLVTHPDATGAMSFPEPRETRCLVLRVAGLPVWREVASVGLPAEIDCSLAALRAADFDAGFDERFRLAQPPRLRFLLRRA